MTRSSTACLVTLLAIGLQSAPSLACGDKFLLTARGARVYRSAVGSGAAAILIYARPSSSAATLVVNEDAAVVLRREGYHVEIVQSPTDFERAFRDRSWDLVLADIGDADAVARDQGGVNAPTLLPVLSRPTASALKQARARFNVAVKGPMKTQAFLNAIDDVLDRRFKAIERRQANAARAATRK